MKKFLTLALGAVAFCASVTADAQERKYWDFTKPLSAETVANLKADAANWTIGAKPQEFQNEAGEQAGWCNAAKITATTAFIANGVEMPEFSGLKVTANGFTGSDNLRIGIQTETLRNHVGEGGGEYLPANANRLRLGKDKMELVLPALKAGQTVTINYSSAKPAANDTGRYLSSEQMTAIDGVPGGGAASDYVSYTRYEITFQVNDNITEPTEIIVRQNGAGCDIYSISIDGGTDVEEAKKVAFVGSAEDLLMSALDASRLDINLIGADDEVSLADLQAYEAVIVSNTVAADAKIVPVLKSAIAHQPMVNFNAALYEAWGLGKAIVSDAQGVTLTDGFAADETFASIANGEALLMDGMLSTIELGDYFAKDAVVATIDGKVAIHRHNAGRNTYINVPMDAACIPTFDGPNAMFTELAVYAASTKREVVAATAPKIEQKNGDMETTVTITAANGAVIHYTLDGTEPTAASPVYTEPLVLTEAKTVKAMVELDGYFDSPVASAEVIIMSKVATPTFDMVKDENSTTVTIECATPGTLIFYSYREFTDTIKAQLYEGPITLSQEPTPIYAMAAAENCVLSDLASDYVAIKSLNKNTIRMDTVSHFSAHQDAWLPAGEKCAYYVWGQKKGWSYYSTEIDHYEDGVDADNNPVQVPVYKPDPAAVKEHIPNAANGTENDWRFVSAGQALCLEAGTGDDGVGFPSDIDGKGKGRYADTAEDLIGGLSTKYFIGTKGTLSGEPLTAAIESVKAFPAPFDVVVYTGNGKGGNKSAELQISTDGKTWTKAADLKVSTYKRYLKKNRVSIDDAGNYYVRVANMSNDMNVGDIYILNNGEVSQKYDAESGIEDVEVAEVEVVRTEIYNISGMLMPEMIQGINIVRTYYSDGSVKTTKVLNR